jgi:hypothetical protein
MARPSARVRFGKSVASDEYFQMRDIPDSVLNDAVLCVKPYTTAFGWNGAHLGGGTFARINGRSGILTAGHVWDHIYKNRSEHPEVQVMISDDAHHYSLPVEYLTPHLSLEAKSEAWGPDVQFVEIPQALVGSVLARKSFAELSAHADKFKKLALQNSGFSAIPGFAGEKVKWVAEGFHGGPLAELHGGYVAGIDRHFEREGYDYLEISADYKNTLALPKSFGGVSGSGIWNFSLHKKAGASVKTAKIGDDFAFAGVAFYEEEAKEDRMIVRYHGPETIYRIVCGLVPKRP